jgi:hypothetical protein
MSAAKRFSQSFQKFGTKGVLPEEKLKLIDWLSAFYRQFSLARGKSIIESCGVQFQSKITFFTSFMQYLLSKKVLIDARAFDKVCPKFDCA